MQHDYFSSFNQSNHWFVALSLTLPSSDLKLPIIIWQTTSKNCTKVRAARAANSPAIRKNYLPPKKNSQKFTPFLFIAEFHFNWLQTISQPSFFQFKPNEQCFRSLCKFVTLAETICRRTKHFWLRYMKTMPHFLRKSKWVTGLHGLLVSFRWSPRYYSHRFFI